MRALSRAPLASGSPRASCARLAAWAAAGALAAVTEAAVAGAEGAGPAAVALAPLPRQRWEHVPHSGGRSWERSAELAPTPAARRGGAWDDQGTAQTGWVTSVWKPPSLGVRVRGASGSLCSSSAPLQEPRKKSCVGRRGWRRVTQREAGGAGT